jgi:hypothetical protein
MSADETFPAIIRLTVVPSDGEGYDKVFEAKINDILKQSKLPDVHLLGPRPRGPSKDYALIIDGASRADNLRARSVLLRAIDKAGLMDSFISAPSI